MPAPHHSVFYRPDALPVAQPTVTVKVVSSVDHWMIIFTSAEGGYVFGSVCLSVSLSVCLSVRRITRKPVNGF